MKTTILLLVTLALAGNLPAVSLYQIDTFDADTASWNNNAGTTSTADTGLTGGAYLEVTSSGTGGRGSRLVTFNSGQWTGDYLTAGIQAFNFDALSAGLDPLNLRFAFDGPGGWFITTNVLLPNSTSVSTLESFSFSIVPSEVTATGSTGTGSYADTFSNVTEFEILAAENIPNEGPGGNLTGDQINAVLWIDNLQAVPEPSVLAISAIAVFSFAARRRRS